MGQGQLCKRKLLDVKSLATRGKDHCPVPAAHPTRTQPQGRLRERARESVSSPRCTWTARVSPGGILLRERGWNLRAFSGSGAPSPEPWGGQGLSGLLAAGGLLAGSADSLGLARSDTVALQRYWAHCPPIRAAKEMKPLPKPGLAEWVFFPRIQTATAKSSIPPLSRWRAGHFRDEVVPSHPQQSVGRAGT